MPSRPSFHFIEHQSDATTPTPIFAETLTATVSGSKLCKNKISSFLLPAENRSAGKFLTRVVFFVVPGCH